jgi:integrase
MLAKLLGEQWLALRNKTSTAFVFTNTLGRAFDYRDVGEAFRKAVKAAGLQTPGKLTLHSLRHSFASMLIAQGLNVVFVSRQLGHSNPNVTLSTYAHLFDRADHAHTARRGRWRPATRRWRPRPGNDEHPFVVTAVW